MNLHHTHSYDLTYLEEISAGDQQFVKSIISQFILEAPAVLDRIKTALQAENWADMEYEVHKFAPNLAFVGIDDLKDKMNTLEEMARLKIRDSETFRLLDSVTKRCELAIGDLKNDFNL